MKHLFSRNAIAVACTSLILAACGGGSGGSSASSGQGPTPSVTTVATLSGTVFAGVTSGATVSVYAANAQGRATGSALATASTDANGIYTISLNAIPTGPVVVVSTGGSYSSEADNSTQTGVGFTILVPSVQAGSNTAQLNALTSAITANVVNQLAGSNPPPVATALSNATTAVELALGLSLSGNPMTLAPDPSATSGDAFKLSALAGTLEQLRNSSSIAGADLYNAFMSDIADGRLDGLKNGQVVTIGSGGSVLQASLFTSQMAGAANTYGANHPTYQPATSAIATASQLSSQAAGVTLGSSGSISVYQTQASGAQIYFAARTDGLVKLDMSNPANPVASKVASVNQALMTANGSTPALFTSIDGIVINPTPSAATGKIYGIVFSYNSKTVVSVNLTDGVIAGQVVLPVNNQVSFSGASTYIAGGVAGQQGGSVWLATANGLVGVDASNLSKPATIINQPAGVQINENIGGDTGHGLVFSPDYLNRGLVVFNLNEGKSYLMNSTDWGTLAGTFTATGELDGTALDSNYQIALITPEGSSTVGLVGYALPSGASGATGSFTSSLFKSVTMPGYAAFSGSAIDPVSHTVLLIGEGSGLGAGVLDNPANANWKGFASLVTAGMSSYSFEPHDPHTAGMFNIGGKPYGFLLQGIFGSYKVVVLDMNAMLAAPATAGVLATDPLTNPAVAKQLSY